MGLRFESEHREEAGALKNLPFGQGVSDVAGGEMATLWSPASAAAGERGLPV